MGPLAPFAEGQAVPPRASGSLELVVHGGPLCSGVIRVRSGWDRRDPRYLVGCFDRSGVWEAGVRAAPSLRRRAVAAGSVAIRVPVLLHGMEQAGQILTATFSMVRGQVLVFSWVVLGSCARISIALEFPL